MPNHEIAVVLPVHLHARPAGLLARRAAQFRSAIRLEAGGQSVDAAGILAVMALGATAGTTVLIRAEGEDAAEAAAALAAVLATAE